MKKPICILFAGPAGSGKSPIASFLSWNLGIPIFSNDEIRKEVLEDTLKKEIDQDHYLNKRDKRLKTLVIAKKDFILDASIDRTWDVIKPELIENDYRWIIISIDINEELLRKTAEAKKYKTPKEVVGKWYREHQEFLKDFQTEPMISITDENFPNRLDLSLGKVREFLSNY